MSVRVPSGIRLLARGFQGKLAAMSRRLLLPPAARGASLSRRRLLAGAAAATAALALPRGAGAIGASSRFRFGQLALGPSWNPRPTALRRLAWELEKRTSVSVELDAKKVALSSDKLHETPFLYLAGDRAFDLPSTRSIEALRRYLTFGGFLLIDSAEGSIGGAFDQSVRKLLEAVFPRPSTNLELISPDHVAFKSFYLIDRPLGRLALSGVLEGVVREDRLVAVYVANDLGGAWARDDFGNYAFPCEPGGEQQRELAFRFGVNLAMYALCLDYKTDQVHVPFIMKRRRWRPDDGANVPEKSRK
ncbi:MAG: DUF4159 domain-containing protein [Kofleriaceae bacterium]